MPHRILALSMDQRSENADFVQKILTMNGCLIKARIGLHEAGDICSNNGLILLQLISEGDISKLLEDLNSLSFVKTKYIEL